MSLGPIDIPPYTGPKLEALLPMEPPRISEVDYIHLPDTAPTVQPPSLFETVTGTYKPGRIKPTLISRRVNLRNFHPYREVEDYTPVYNHMKIGFQL